MAENINQKEKISIILPVFNGQETLQISIDSVLKQTYKNIELIILNNNSNDNTEEIILRNKEKDSRIVYVKNSENLGLQRSLNIGINKASGKYIARIDADDEWIDDKKIQRQYNFLEKNPEYVLVGTNIISPKINQINRVFNPETDQQIRRKIIGRNCFAHSSVMFKKDAVLIVGGYSESDSEKYVEDYDLWLKMGHIGKMFNIQEFCVKYESGPESISNKNKKQQVKNHFLLVQKYYNEYKENLFFNKLKNLFRFIYYTYIKK